MAASCMSGSIAVMAMFFWMATVAIYKWIKGEELFYKDRGALP